MAEIRLSRGKVALVDDSDFEVLSQWNWTFDGHGYAHRMGRKSEGIMSRCRISMHRQIMGVVDPNIEVDHVNHNTLDNRRVNLRACSRSLNMGNQRLCKDSSSGYKGVSFLRKYLNRNKPWRAKIQVRKVEVSLGYFSTKEQAALAYNEAAKQHFGEFAHLNSLKGV